MKQLEITNLKTYFHSDEGLVKAVDDVSFYTEQGEILAIVGESGCGKSVTLKTVLGLHPPSNTEITGSILYNGRELLGLSHDDMRKVRGREIGMIFQEPMSAFDPLYTVGEQIEEALLAHFTLSKADARDKIVSMLDDVGIPAAAKRYDEYPHQMSGGMLQRFMIALNLVCEPGILIADEPTTALDVTIQAQVLNLMRDLQQETATTIILITHDLGIVAEIADRVHVMYAGKIVEKSVVKDIYANPLHPYTRGLLKSKIERTHKQELLPYIEGTVPRAFEFPAGCRFHPRCPSAEEICRERLPPFYTRGTQEVACWRYKDEK